MATKRSEKAEDEATERKRRRESGPGRRKESQHSTLMDMSQNPDFVYTQTMEKEAKVGVIEHVSLQNFMNHAIFEMDFGLHVNFIVGNNGTGKSAVLTAIIVGLGGKASFTDRGKSVKSFIKRGKRTATTRIRLRNGGTDDDRDTDAYKPDLYGQSITVERKLTIEGGSSYKLLNESMKQVSTKKEELDAILDHFNIEVDNPIVVLNQDAAKTFVFTKNAKDKYKFFMKSTRLEEIRDYYHLSSEKIKQTRQTLDEKDVILAKMKEDVDFHQKKYESFKSLTSLEQRLSDRKKELAWVLVNESEKRMTPVINELKTEEARMPKFTEKRDEVDAKMKTLEEEHTAIQEDLKLIAEEAEALNPRYDREQANVHACKQRLKIATDRLRVVTKECATIETDKHAIEERIQRLKDSDASEYQQALDERNNHLHRLKENLSTLRLDEKNKQQEVNQYRDAVAELRQQSNAIVAEERDLIGRKQAVQKAIDRCIASRRDKYSCYGQWALPLVQAIDEAYKRKEFNQKPRGPLGSLVTLREPDWALAIEICIGKGLLCAFAVTDFHDEKVLEKLFQRFCPPNFKPTIITSQFQPTLFQVPANTTAHPTVLEMLNISDPIVSNCLVDQRGIEKILLIRDDKSARSFLNDKGRPQAFSEVFTKDGYHVLSFPSLRQYAPNTSSSRYLTANVEDNIRQYEVELEGFKDKLKVVEGRKKLVENEISTNVAEQKLAERRLNKCYADIAIVNGEITTLTNTEIPAPVDLSTLEDELTLLNSKLASLSCEKSKADDAVRKLRDDMSTAEETFKDIDKRIKDAAHKLEPYKRKLASKQEELETAKEHKKHYTQKLKEHTRKVEELRTRFNTYKRSHEEEKEKALEFCDGEVLSTNKTETAINTEIAAINKQLQTEQKSRGKFDDVQRIYFEKRETFERVKNEYNQLRNFNEKLAETIVQRQLFYKKKRDSITMRIKMSFVHNLEMRRYKGKLNVSHAEHTIESIVIPLSQTAVLTNGESASNRSLSGGERSYSTSCFILALWDVMESPFRCLDEFDIFMDMVNRRIAFEMMLNSAASKPGCQFVFLSPQDMCDLSSAPRSIDVKIFEMPEPERTSGNNGSQPAITQGGEENNSDDNEGNNRR